MPWQGSDGLKQKSSQYAKNSRGDQEDSEKNNIVRGSLDCSNLCFKFLQPILDGIHPLGDVVYIPEVQQPCPLIRIIFEELLPERIETYTPRRARSRLWLHSKDLEKSNSLSAWPQDDGCRPNVCNDKMHSLIFHWNQRNGVPSIAGIHSKACQDQKAASRQTELWSNVPA